MERSPARAVVGAVVGLAVMATLLLAQSGAASPIPRAQAAAQDLCIVGEFALPCTPTPQRGLPIGPILVPTATPGAGFGPAQPLPPFVAATPTPAVQIGPAEPPPDFGPVVTSTPARGIVPQPGEPQPQPQLGVSTCLPPIVDTATAFSSTGPTIVVRNVLAPDFNTPTVRGLLRFDLNSLPSGATVSSAQLRMYLDEAPYAASATIYVFRITGSWSEPVSLAGQPSFAYPPSATAQVSSSEGWKTWNVTGLVQGWMSGAAPNHGVLITGPGPGVSEGNEPTYSRHFRSKDYGGGSHPPCLQVHYSAPSSGPTTEPGQPAPTPTSPPPTWTPAATWTPVPPQPTVPLTDLPTYTPGNAPWDYRVAGVDVMQTIEIGPMGGDPSVYVGLVADKTMLVRVFVGGLHNGGREQWYFEDITVALQALRDGTPMAQCSGPNLQPQTQQVLATAVRGVDPVSGSPITWPGPEGMPRGAEYRFVIPRTCPWLDAGNVTLRAVLSPQSSIFGADMDAGNDTRDQSLRFHSVRPVRIQPYFYRYENSSSMNDGAIPNAAELIAVSNFMRDLFPVSAVDMKSLRILEKSANLDFPSGSEAFSDGISEILDFFKDVGRDDVDSNLLLVDNVLFTGSGLRGRAPNPGRHALCSSGGPDTCAHEVMHNFGFSHSSCSHGEEDGGGCIDLSPHGRLLHAGWDPSAGPQLIGTEGAGWHSHDAMAYGSGGCNSGPGPDPANPATAGPYCSDNWIHERYYTELAQLLYCDDPQSGMFPIRVFCLDEASWPGLTAGSSDYNAANPDRPAAPLELTAATAGQVPNGRQYLDVSARIHQDGRAELLPFYQRTEPRNAYDGAGSGPYRLDLQAEDGTVLFSRNLEPGRVMEGGPRGEPALVREAVPWDPATSQVVLARGDEVLARRSVSSTAPTVTLLEPNGGEEWDGAGEAMVRWLAEDADGGELAYWVEYSADGGESWQTLRRNVAESSLTVNLVNLEGSARALIRVLATDGVNTVADTSDSTFAVARKAPWVGIGTPAANTEVPAGSEVRFEGIALDQEDGMLSGAAMVWESDVDGMIGSGELLSGRLTTGTHRVTLTATDSDGQQASTEVVVVAR